jgi:ubiquinone biosynthesis protein Coq4
MEVYLPWAIKVGKKSKNFMGIYFEKYLNENIETFRKNIGFELPKKL